MNDYDWTAAPTSQAEWRARINTSLSRMIGVGIQQIPSAAVDGLYNQGATYRQATVACVSYCHGKYAN